MKRPRRRAALWGAAAALYGVSYLDGARAIRDELRIASGGLVLLSVVW